jgi:hypothetical protein
MTDTGITVAGRSFRPVTPRRLEHFQYVSFKLLAADAMDGGPIADLCAKVADAGYGPELFAGLYVECDDQGPLPWTVKRAKALAADLRKSPSLEDWNTVTIALMQGLLRFFGPAAASSDSSPSCSAEVETTPTSEASGPLVLSGSPS